MEPKENGRFSTKPRDLLIVLFADCIETVIDGFISRWRASQTASDIATIWQPESKTHSTGFLSMIGTIDWRACDSFATISLSCN